MIIHNTTTKSILFLLGRYPSIGGVESITTNMSNAFVEIGYNVHIVSFEAACGLEEMGLDHRVSTLLLSYPVYSNRNKKILSAYVREHKIDVVINNWCLPFYVTRLIKYCIKHTECKYLGVYHNNPLTNARLKNCEIRIEEKQGLQMVNKLKWQAINLASRLSLKYVYRNCDRLVLLSPSFIFPLKKYIWEKNGAKIISIPNSLEGSYSGERYNKDKEILYLGRIDYNQKRVRRVIEIWNQLESRYPDWHLTIVGDGPDMETVKSMVAKYRLKNVYFEGFQKADKYFQRAPMMLLVSEYEGFPLVLVEAQSYGCVPVALDSFTALHDIVENRKNGVIIDYPYQVEKFVSAISKLIEDKEMLEKCEGNAIKNVDKFKLQCVMNMWFKLFKEVCNESK